MSNEEITLKDVYRLLENVNNNLNKRINNLEQTCKNAFENLQIEITSLKGKYESIEKENTNLKVKLEIIERKSKSNNLVIYGIEQITEETQEHLMKVTQKIFEDVLNIKINTSEINNIYRIGKISNKTRPVLISLTTNIRKSEILGSAKKFKGSQFSISPDLTIQEQQQRRLLVSELKKAKNNGKISFIKKNTLFIDGNKYTVNEILKKTKEETETDIDNNIPSPVIERRVSSEPSTPSPKEIEEEDQDENERQVEKLHQTNNTNIVVPEIKNQKKKTNRINSYTESGQTTPARKEPNTQKRQLRKQVNK